MSSGIIETGIDKVPFEEADDLFEITIVGLIGMFCFCTALSIDFMLLPLPEIKIASLSNA